MLETFEQNYKTSLLFEECPKCNHNTMWREEKVQWCIRRDCKKQIPTTKTHVPTYKVRLSPLAVSGASRRVYEPVEYTVVPFNPLYAINEDAELVHINTGFTVELYSKRGILYAGLSKWSKPVAVPLHEIMLRTFTDDHQPRRRYYHLDGDTKNNTISNLSLFHS